MKSNSNMYMVYSNARRFSMTSCALKYERMPRSIMFIRPERINVDSQVANKLATGQFIHRKHPGKATIGAVHPPRQFERSFIKGCGDVDFKSLTKEAKKLSDYLVQRQVPIESECLEKKREKMLHKEIERLVLKYSKKMNETSDGSPTDEEVYEHVEGRKDWLRKKVEAKIHRTTYHWKPTDYKVPSRCLSYALSRFPADYAVLCRILSEIKGKYASFVPRTVFDFGSGVGSTIWAVESVWNKTHRFKETFVEAHDEDECLKGSDGIQNQAGNHESNSSVTTDEIADSDRSYFCVDVSAQMIDLASRLLRGGEICGQSIFDNIHVYFRQFLPALPDPKYDLVVSSFALMEVPSYEERMRVVLNLWHKTDHFLVLAEQGNRYGFTLLMEIRDYILCGGQEVRRQELQELLASHSIDSVPVDAILSNKRLNNREKYKSICEILRDFNLDIPTLIPTGHLVAPCPHEFGCPRMADVLPCKFEQAYFELQLTGSEEKKIHRQSFSYLILEKRRKDSSNKSEQKQNWPRLVRPVLLRRRHVLCEMCTSQGLLSEATVTRGNAGCDAYRMLRKSQWGDTWPAHLEFTSASFERLHRLANAYVERQVKKEGEVNQATDLPTGNEEWDDDRDSEAVHIYNGTVLHDKKQQQLTDEWGKELMDEEREKGVMAIPQRNVTDFQANASMISVKNLINIADDKEFDLYQGEYNDEMLDGSEHSPEGRLKHSSCAQPSN